MTHLKVKVSPPLKEAEGRQCGGTKSKAACQAVSWVSKASSQKGSSCSSDAWASKPTADTSAPRNLLANKKDGHATRTEHDFIRHNRGKQYRASVSMPSEGQQDAPADVRLMSSCPGCRTLGSAPSPAKMGFNNCPVEEGGCHGGVGWETITNVQKLGDPDDRLSLLAEVNALRVKVKVQEQALQQLMGNASEMQKERRSKGFGLGDGQTLFATQTMPSGHWSSQKGFNVGDDEFHEEVQFTSQIGACAIPGTSKPSRMVCEDRDFPRVQGAAGGQPDRKVGQQVVRLQYQLFHMQKWCAALHDEYRLAQEELYAVREKMAAADKVADAARRVSQLLGDSHKHPPMAVSGPPLETPFLASIAPCGFSVLEEPLNKDLLATYRSASLTELIKHADLLRIASEKPSKQRGFEPLPPLDDSGEASATLRSRSFGSATPSTLADPSSGANHLPWLDEPAPLREQCHNATEAMLLPLA